MKEYLLLVKPDGGHLDVLSAEEKQEHLNRVVAYIQKLVKDNKLINAQPLAKGGHSISGRNSKITDGPFIETKEEIAGYFLITAESFDEAIEIAKQNPMFQLEAGGTIDIRPIQSINQV